MCSGFSFSLCGAVGTLESTVWVYTHRHLISGWFCINSKSSSLTILKTTSLMDVTSCMFVSLGPNCLTKRQWHCQILSLTPNNLPHYRPSSVFIFPLCYNDTQKTCSEKWSLLLCVSQTEGRNRGGLRTRLPYKNERRESEVTSTHFPLLFSPFPTEISVGL